MLNNIKATLFRYCEMSWPALIQLKAWMKHSASLNGFDMESFSNPTLRVASATNERGETVCYCPIETVLVARYSVVNPTATPSEAQIAGDGIDRELELHAQRNGISRVFVVLPENMPRMSNEKSIRVVERKITNTVAMHGIDSGNQPHVAKYVN